MLRAYCMARLITIYLQKMGVIILVSLCVLELLLITSVAFVLALLMIMQIQYQTKSLS